MTIIPRRAHRQYIYGPDILQEVLVFIREKYGENFFKIFNLSCHDVLMGYCVIEEVIDFKTVSQYKSICKYKSSEGQRVIGVREVPAEDIPVIPYDEDAVVVDSCINEDDSWSVTCVGKDVSYVHIAVALNKKMLTATVDMPSGYKWSFARLMAKDYAEDTLRKQDQITIKYEGEFNGKFYKSSIQGLGELYFYLTPKEIK